MKLVKNKFYRIKGESSYFKKKYDTSNPMFRYEMTDIEAWGKSWSFMSNNPCAMLFGMRTGIEGIKFDLDDIVCYGHVKMPDVDGYLAELVHISELEEVEDES